MQEKKALKIALIVITVILILLVLWIVIIVGIKLIKKEPVTIKDAFSLNTIQSIFSKEEPEETQENTAEELPSRRPDAGMHQTQEPTVEEEKNVEVQEDGTKVNKSEEVTKEKEVDGLKIRNVRISGKDNQTYIIADVVNETDKKRGGYGVDITILDDDNEVMAIIGGYIDEVEPGQSIVLYATSTLDYANAYDIKIEKSE